MSRRMTAIGVFGAGAVVGIATLVYLAGNGRESTVTHAQQGNDKAGDRKNSTVFLAETMTKRKLDGGKSPITITIIRRIHRSGEIIYYLQVVSAVTVNLSLDDATDLVALTKYVKTQKKSPAKEVLDAWVNVPYRDFVEGNAQMFYYDLAKSEWSIGIPGLVAPSDFAAVLTEQVQEVQRLKGVPPSFKF